MKNKRAQMECAGCGRGTDEGAGPWLLCQACGTFRCSDCYGNPFDAAGCPGCRKRANRKAPVDFLTRAVETAFAG